MTKKLVIKGAKEFSDSYNRLVEENKKLRIAYVNLKKRHDRLKLYLKETTIWDRIKFVFTGNMEIPN